MSPAFTEENVRKTKNYLEKHRSSLEGTEKLQKIQSWLSEATTKGVNPRQASAISVERPRWEEGSEPTSKREVGLNMLAPSPEQMTDKRVEELETARQSALDAVDPKVTDLQDRAGQESLAAEKAYVESLGYDLATGVPMAPPPLLERPAATSKGSWMTARMFAEPSADEANEALARPEIRRLVLTDRDLFDSTDTDRRNPRVPAVQEGSELHRRVADAMWAVMHDKDEAMGAKLLRPSKMTDLTPLQRFGLGTWKYANALGELALEFDRGMTGGLLQNALAEGASAVTGLDEASRLEEARGELSSTGLGQAGAIAANIAGAVSPMSVGSMAARAGAGLVGGAGMGAAALRGLAGGAAAGGTDALARGVADSMSGQLNPEQLATDVALGAGVGGAVGGALAPLGALAAKGVQKFHETNPEFAAIGRAGGRLNVTWPTVSLPPRLEAWGKKAARALERENYAADTGSDLAADATGNRLLGKVRQYSETGKAVREMANRDIYAATDGKVFTDPAPFVAEMKRIAKDAKETLWGQDAGAGRELAKRLGVKLVPTRVGSPYSMSMKDGRALFGQAIDDLVEQLDPTVQARVNQPGAYSVEVRSEGWTPRKLDETLAALADKIGFAKKGESTNLAGTLKRLYGVGMELRKDFDVGPAGDIARKWGADSYSGLKKQFEQQITRESGLRTGIGFRGEEIPEALPGKTLMQSIDPNTAQQIRAAVQSASPTHREAFKILSDMDPKVAQELADVLGMEAAEGIRKGGVSTHMSAGANPAQDTALRYTIGKQLLSPRVYSALQATSAEVPKIDFKTLEKALDGLGSRSQGVWEFITQTTPKAQGALRPRSGYASLVSGAPARVLNLERLLALSETARLLRDSVSEEYEEAKDTVSRALAPPVQPRSPAQERLETYE